MNFVNPFHSTVGLIWYRGIRRGVLTLWREGGWVTALSSLVGVFLLLQVLCIVYLGVEGVQTLLKAESQIRLEVREGADPQLTREFYSAVTQLPYIEDSTYVTREEAYAQMKQSDPEFITFLEDFAMDNPFPETIGVTLASLDDYGAFKSFLEHDSWKTVVDPTFLSQATSQEAHIHQLLRITHAGRMIAVSFLVLTGVILIFLTIELVRRRVMSRREEILIEHLSGAQSFSILLPFATEATLLLLFALVGSALLLSGLWYLIPFISPQFIDPTVFQGFFNIMEHMVRTYLPYILLIQFIILPVIGWCGAWLGSLSKMGMRSLATL